jgi:hypothetical protein
VNAGSEGGVDCTGAICGLDFFLLLKLDGYGEYKKIPETSCRSSIPLFGEMLVFFSRGSIRWRSRLPVTSEFRDKSSFSRRSRYMSASSIKTIPFHDVALSSHLANFASMVVSSVPRSATVNDSNGLFVCFATHSNLHQRAYIIFPGGRAYQQ